MPETYPPQSQDILAKAQTLRSGLSTGFRDEMVKSLYAEAERIANRAVQTKDQRKYDFDQRIDRIVTSPIFGLPIMLLILAVIFWLTVFIWQESSRKGVCDVQF